MCKLNYQSLTVFGWLWCEAASSLVALNQPQRNMPTSATVNRPMRLFEWSLLLTLSVLWGGSFFFNGIAIRELPTFTVVFCRVALAALILWAALRLAGEPMPRAPRTWAAFFGIGLLNNVLPFSLIVWGQSHIASGVASILNATTPLFTVVVAHLLTSDEKLNSWPAGGSGHRPGWGRRDDRRLVPRHLGGMALIGLGLAAIDGRPWRALRSAFTGRPSVAHSDGDGI